MTPERFNEILDALDWSYSVLARRLSTPERSMPEKRVRRWGSGTQPIPREITAWLERWMHAADRLGAAPPGWRGLQTGMKGTVIATPDGPFRTVVEAAKHYGITREGGYSRLSRGAWRRVAPTLGRSLVASNPNPPLVASNPESDAHREPL